MQVTSLSERSVGPEIVGIRYVISRARPPNSSRACHLVALAILSRLPFWCELILLRNIWECNFLSCHQAPRAVLYASVSIFNEA